MLSNGNGIKAAYIPADRRLLGSSKSQVQTKCEAAHLRGLEPDISSMGHSPEVGRFSHGTDARLPVGSGTNSR